MNMPSMGAPVSPHLDALALVLRLVLLLATAVLAGTGLFRPAVEESTRRLRGTAVAAAALAAIANILSIILLSASIPFTIVQIVLSLALPVLLRWPTLAVWNGFALTVLLIAEVASGHTSLEFLAFTAYTVAAVVWLGLTAVSLTSGGQAWRSGAIRPGPIALTVGVVMTIAGIVPLATIGFDRRLYETGFGRLAVLVVLLPVAFTVLALIRHRVDAIRIGAVAVVPAFVAWSALAVLPNPPDLPTPGVPLLADVSLAGQQVPVLVSPQRPGKNLVHFPDSAGTNVSVAAGGLPVRAVARPGASGTWAEVDLPAGRSDLVVDQGGKQATVQVDAGSVPGPASAVGPDGPECASAALGGLMAGARNVLTACPADTLSTSDAGELRGLVSYLASKSVPAITLIGDGSPRSQQAVQVVRDSAANAHIQVGSTPTPDSALVQVSGWSSAAQQVHAAALSQTTQRLYAAGIYLAPWLLNAPVVNLVPTTYLPLQFDPRDQQALSYGIAVQNGFGGEAPSVAGYQQWLLAHQESISGPTTIYGAAQVSAMPMDSAADGMDMSTGYPGQWVTGGTIVPVSGPLSS